MFESTYANKTSTVNRKSSNTDKAEAHLKQGDNSTNPLARIIPTSSPYNPIQTKLTVGKSNDKYEREADSIADKVMTMPVLLSGRSNLGTNIQRECTGCREDESLQMKPLSSHIIPFIQKQVEEEEPLQTKPDKSQITPWIQKQVEEEEPVQTKSTDGQSSQDGVISEAKLHSGECAGKPLSETTRNYFEPRFGQDFSNVKVHTCNSAVQMSRELNAQAFTHRNNIFFNQGKYKPGTSSGKKLIAHELTHVVQQSNQPASSMILKQEDTQEPPKSVIRNRIDIRAQFAFLRLFKSNSPQDRMDAIDLFHKVDRGEVKGIYGDDLGIAAQIAAKRGTVRWELVPSGQDAVWMEDEMSDTPVIIFKASAGKASRLDQALLFVYRTRQQQSPLYVLQFQEDIYQEFEDREDIGKATRDAIELMLTARNRLVRLRNILNAGGTVQGQDLLTLQAVDRWLHVNPNNPMFFNVLNQAISHIETNLQINSISEIRPAMCSWWLFRNSYALALPGDPRRIIKYCSHFFDNGPLCRRDVTIHERFHLIGLVVEREVTYGAVFSVQNMVELVRDTAGQSNGNCDARR